MTRFVQEFASLPSSGKVRSASVSLKKTRNTFGTRQRILRPVRTYCRSFSRGPFEVRLDHGLSAFAKWIFRIPRACSAGHLLVLRSAEVLFSSAQWRQIIRNYCCLCLRAVVNWSLLGRLGRLQRLIQISRKNSLGKVLHRYSKRLFACFDIPRAVSRNKQNFLGPCRPPVLSLSVMFVPNASHTGSYLQILIHFMA